MNYTFRNYKEKDYELIYNLKKQAYKEYVAHFFEIWDDEKQHEFFDNYIKNQRDRIKIIMLNGINIIDKPEYQGKGIGTDILKNTIKEHLKNEILIQCFKTNPVKNLYFKLGFEETEQTKTHIKMKLNKEKFKTYKNTDFSLKKEKLWTTKLDTLERLKLKQKDWF